MASQIPETYYTGLQDAGVSAEEAARYYTTFKLFDTDGSDTMDSGELFSCLQVLGQNPKSKEDADKLLKEHDVDGSGSMNFLEFAKLMSHVCKPTSSVRDDLIMSFQVFDKDHSGYLDKQELRDAIYSMGKVNLTDKEFDQLMKAADTNGDGKIDYSEFTAILTADITKMIESSKKKVEEKKHNGGGGKDGGHHGDKQMHKKRKHSGGSGSRGSSRSRSRHSSRKSD